MKKLLRLLAFTLIVILLIIPAVSLADAGGAASSEAGIAISTPLIEYAVQIAATLLITLIGVLGTWLTLQLGKSTKLKNINDAQKELIKAAKVTVGELQQRLVTDLKAANQDGKLTQQEIAQLRGSLLDKTTEKLSAPAYAILSAASVDIEGMILGVGEAWIDTLKSGGADPTADEA